MPQASETDISSPLWLNFKIGEKSQFWSTFSFSVETSRDQAISGLLTITTFRCGLSVLGGGYGLLADFYSLLYHSCDVPSYTDT